MEFKPRALTLPELRECRGMDANEADIFAISKTCDLTVEIVREWFNSCPAGESMAVIQAVYTASGMGEDATKSGPAANDVRPPRARK